MTGKSMTIGVRVDPELYKKLKAMASKDKRTLSQFCKLVLAEYVQKDQKDNKPT